MGQTAVGDWLAASQYYIPHNSHRNLSPTPMCIHIGMGRVFVSRCNDSVQPSRHLGAGQVPRCQLDPLAVVWKLRTNASYDLRSLRKFRHFVCECSQPNRIQLTDTQRLFVFPILRNQDVS